MDGWDFRVTWSQRGDGHIATIGMGFRDALVRAVEFMLEEGRPWGENDVGVIHLSPPYGWVGPKRRPLLTFMAPMGAKGWEENDGQGS